MRLRRQALAEDRDVPCGLCLDVCRCFWERTPVPPERPELAPLSPALAATRGRTGTVRRLVVPARLAVVKRPSAVIVTSPARRSRATRERRAARAVAIDRK